MFMKRYLVLFCAFVVSNIYAQQLPWANLLVKKQVDINLKEVPVFLVTDTLRQKSTDKAAKETNNFFYNSSVDLIGYGYKDAEGNPYGVWRYYSLKGKEYVLYCEGYYKKLAAANLVVEPDIIKRFPVSDALKTKEDFISSLSDQLFFTGEWRFYKDGHLEKMIQLDERVHLPYQLSVSLVSQSQVKDKDLMVDQLNILMPVNRLTGNLAIYMSFSASGVIESIFSENLRWKFDPNGKPVIKPLPD